MLHMLGILSLRVYKTGYQLAPQKSFKGNTLWTIYGISNRPAAMHNVWILFDKCFLPDDLSLTDLIYQKELFRTGFR